MGPASRLRRGNLTRLGNKVAPPPPPPPPPPTARRPAGRRHTPSTRERGADKIAALAEYDTVVTRFIDYRTAGPGTLPEIFGKADVIVCTEDSSTMISEAVSAGLPVVGAAPAAHRFTDEEQDYRNFMVANGWCRVLPIAELTPPSFAKALSEIEPPRDNPLDVLAAKLKARLRQLFSENS